METYLIEPYGGPNAKAQGWLRFAAMALVTAVTYFCVVCLLPWNHPRPWQANAEGAAIFGLISTWLRRLTQGKRPNDESIIVKADSIVSKRRGIATQIYLDEIRTLRELPESWWRPGGLLISKRGRLGTFLQDGVFVPRRLPEYEAIKRFVQLGMAEEPTS